MEVSTQSRSALVHLTPNGSLRLVRPLFTPDLTDVPEDESCVGFGRDTGARLGTQVTSVLRDGPG